MIYLLLAGLYLSRARSAPVELLVNSSVIREEIGTAPLDRTLSTIILTCLSTTLACTWISVHPNLPHNRRRFTSPLLRLLLSFYALIAPEAILFWALVQWNAARRYIKDDKFKDYNWTITHGFFLIMGGFTIPYEENDDRILLRSLPAQEFEYLVEKGLIEFPNVSEADLLDKSKGDPLAKTFVVLQTLGFAIQILARYRQHLVITELELITFALVPLNMATYGFWMHKPLSVQQAIPVRWKDGKLPTQDDMEHYVTESGKAADEENQKIGEENQPVDEKPQVVEHLQSSSPISTHAIAEEARIIPTGQIPVHVPLTAADSASVDIMELLPYDPPYRALDMTSLGYEIGRTGSVESDTKAVISTKFTAFVEWLTETFEHITEFWAPEPDQIDKNPANRTNAQSELQHQVDQSAPKPYVPGDTIKSKLREIPSMRGSTICQWVIGIILVGVPLAAIVFVIGLGGVAIILGIILSAMLVTLVYGVLKRVLTIPTKGMKAFSAIGGEEPDTLNGPRRRFPTLYAPGKGIKYHSTLRVAVIGATVFGGIHVLGWNLTFPTSVERILWRTSSIALATIPLSSFLLFHVVKFFSVWDKDAGNQWIRRPTMYLYMCVLILSIYVYPVARVYVLVESIIALRDPSPGTFTAVAWSKFFPYF